MDSEKRWISPHLLAGYGVLTWTMYHAMEKVSMAFGDVGNFGVIRVGGVTGAWGHIASSMLFVPSVCILSTVPLCIYLFSHIPHTWNIKASIFRGVMDETEEDSSEQLVDPSRKVTLSQDGVVSSAQDSTFESGGSDWERQESVSKVADVVLLADQKRKKRKIHRG